MGELSYTVGGDSNLVSFKSATRVPITSLKAHFKPKQDLHGYSKPWPAGGGKNLYNVAHDTISNNTIINSSFEYVNNEYYATSGYVEVLPSTEYTLSAALTNTFGAIFVCQCNENKEFIGERLLVYYTANKTVATFTTREDCKYIRFGGAKNNGDDSVHLLFDTFQLEKGSAATSYEPYSNICPIEGWNGIEINKCRKNLLPSGTYIKEVKNQGVLLEYNNGALHIKCEGTGTNGYVFFDLPDEFMFYLPDGTYTLSGGTNEYGGGYIYLYLIVNTLDIEFKTSSATVVTKTITGGQTKLQVAVKTNLAMDVTLYPQLEAGSVATEYEPYHGETIPITFPNISKNLFEFTPFNETDWNTNHVPLSPTTDTNTNTITITGYGSGDSQLYNLKNVYYPGTYTFSFDMTYVSERTGIAKRMVIRCYNENNELMNSNDVSIEGFTYN